MCLKSVLRTNWIVMTFFLQRKHVHALEEYGIYVETPFLFYGFIKAIRIVTMEKFFL